MNCFIRLIIALLSAVPLAAAPMSSLVLDKIPNCASIRVIKYSPTGKYIFIADQKSQAFLIRNTGELVQEWRYANAYYDSVWNKQMDNQLKMIKLLGSMERGFELAKTLPEEYRKRFLDNYKPCRTPALLPPNGLIIQKDTLELPPLSERKKLLPQMFDNAYFANDSLLFISATITIMAIDTFRFVYGSAPPTRASKCFSIIKFSIPDKKQQIHVLSFNFEKNTFPMECLSTFAVKDSTCEEIYHQIEFDRDENEERYLSHTDFTTLGAIGMFNMKTSKLVRTYGIIPQCYRYEKINSYSHSEAIAHPNRNGSLDVVFPLWDSVQVCDGSKIGTYPLNITPNNDTMFEGFKNKTTEEFSELYSKQNFFISQMQSTKHNTVVLIIQQKGENKKKTWLVREYNQSWEIIKEKRIEDSIENSKVHFTGYKADDSTICYVTLDKDENWQLNYIPF